MHKHTNIRKVDHQNCLLVHSSHLTPSLRLSLRKQNFRANKHVYKNVHCVNEVNQNFKFLKNVKMTDTLQKDFRDKS